MPANSNRIWTFEDLHEGGGPGIAVSAAEKNGAGNAGGAPQHLSCCCHIPTLPKAEQAQQLLQRVVREFEPIAKQRGYNVQSVSELCCCGDGLDHLPGRRRKLRKVANNIWGYNQTTWGGQRKSHTIHLRLRHPTDHSKFLLYEDVAGTMAHELAHCEHGPHNDKFFKLMDEILEQHAVLMASGLSSQGYTMPAFGGTGQKLGGNSTGSSIASIQDARRKQQQHLQNRGYKLGGDNAFTKWMTPAEAAVVAAEARRRMQQLRLRGDRCCRPVTIHIDDDESEDDNDKSSNADENDNKKNLDESGDEVVEVVAKRPLKNKSNDGGAEQRRRQSLDNKRSREATTTSMEEKYEENRKPPAKKSAPHNNQAVDATEKEPVVIDLTVDDDNGGEDLVLLPVSRSTAAAAAIRSDSATGSSNVGTAGSSKWACRCCTFLNVLTVAACAMCDVQRDDASTRAYRLRIFM
jgi:DNA-dependent metalloprotease WSS1